MNKGLAFGLGLVFGAAGAGVVVNKVLKQTYEQKATDEITACREAFLNESAKLRDELNKKNAEEQKQEAEEASKKYGGDVTKASPTTDQEDHSKKVPPYEISEEVFEDPANPYKPVSLLYFPGDGILMREDESFMDRDDIEATIGLSALDSLNDEDNDCDHVIMRNEFFQRDYEVVCQNVSYKDWKNAHHNE